MSEVGPGDERDGDRTDDDALADAILATYTSSIPVVGSAAEPVAGTEPVDPGAAPSPAPAPEPSPAPEAAPVPEPAPAPEPEPEPSREFRPEVSIPSLPDPVVVTESPSVPAPAARAAEPVVVEPVVAEPVVAPAPAPGASPAGDPTVDAPGGPRVWDLDEDDEPASSRVWDLGDLPPSIPFETPAPAADAPAGEPDAADLAAPEQPWTRLVEPPPPADEVEPPSPPVYEVPTAWAPPVWEPEPVEPLEPTAILEPDPEPAPSSAPSPSAFAVYADAGVDPEALERMQSALTEDEPTAEPPAAPPEGAGVRREPMPWFDLASAPPPNPSSSASIVSPDEHPAPEFPPPTPPALIEPPPTEPVVPTLRDDPAPAASTETPDAPADLSEGPVADAHTDDPVDPPPESPATTSELPTIASLPPGTVRTSRLPAAAAGPPLPEPAAEAEAASDVPGPALPPTGAATDPAPLEQLPGVRPVERSGIEPTPRDQRAGRAGRLFWLWFAPNASVLALAAGAVLFSSGMSLRQSIIAALLGVVLSFLPLGVASIAARGSGQPTLVTSRATFGIVGNVVPVVVAVLSRVVVGGAVLWVGGEATRIVMGRLPLPGAWGPVGVGVIGIVAVVLGAVGYGLLSRALFVLASLTAILLVGLVTLTAPRVDLSTALSVPDGPWVLLVTGVVLVMSLVGLAWAQSGGDVARYQSRTGSGSGTVVAASAGAAVPALALLVWGALLAASSPAIARGLGTSPVDAVVRLLPSWAALPFLGLVVVTCVAGAATASYSGGFALIASGIRMPRAAAAVVSGVLVLAVGLGLTASGIGTRSVLADVLTTTAVPVAAWVGIVGGETLIRRRRFHTPSLLGRGGIYRDVRVVNLLALAAVTAVGWGFTSATLAGLTWQGYLLAPLGLRRGDPIAESDVGVLIALGLALLVPLVTAIGPVRRQEAVRASAHGDGSPRAA